MPSDGELATPITAYSTSIDKLVAYRAAFSGYLVRLRERSGYTREQAARAIGIPSDTLRLYENATWRPSMRRLLRLAVLYDIPLLDLLEDVARAVQPAENSSLPYLVEAILLFGGVVPEQLSSGADGVEEVVDEGDIDDTGAVPLGELLRYRREDDPLRVKGAMLLKREYEAGASIRALSARHKLAFGTIRTMLVTANTRLRSSGRSHPRDA